MFPLRRVLFFLALLVAAGVNAGPAYPLKLQSGAHYMVDQNGIPFFVQGQSPWFFQAALNYSNQNYYLSNVAAQAYNSIILDLTENDSGTAAGNADFYGNSAFTNTIGGFTDFSTPNVRYFTNLDNIISLSASYGICVMGYPLYDGFNGTQWYAQMSHSSSNNLWAYGNFIGNRYKNFTNIVWIGAGDDNEANAGTTNDLWSIVAKGIKSADSNHLITAQAARPNPATFYGWVTVNATYPNYFTYVQSLASYQQSPVIASFDREPYYFGRAGIQSYTLGALDTRAFGWWSALSGDAGCYYGDDSSTGWQFGAGWPAALWGSAPTTFTNIYQCLRTRKWWNFVPDTNHSVLISGFGTSGQTNYVPCARGSDGVTVMAYTMGGSPSLQIAMTNLSAFISVGWWYNPRTAAATKIGVFNNTGNQTFTPPDANDWVLVLDSQAPGFDPPGAVSLIAKDNMNAWIPGVTVGYRGNMPSRTTLIDVTQAPYNADNTGTLDTSAAFTSAFAAAGSNQVVYVPDGRYIISNGVNVTQGFVTMRGNTNSMIIGLTAGSFIFKFGKDRQGNGNEYAITNGYTKGSTNLFFATAPATVSKNDIIEVAENDYFGSEVFPVISVHKGPHHLIDEEVVVTSISSNMITISSPLLFDFTNGPVIVDMGLPSGQMYQQVGIENIIFTCSNSVNHATGTPAFMLWCSELHDSWITNCQFLTAYGYSTAISDCSHVNFQHNTTRFALGAGSNHGGLLLGCSLSLIGDNILADGLQPGIEFNTTACGNVFVGNFFTNNAVGFDVDNHGPHPLMNLWEENIFSGYFELDGYFGSGSHQTLLRNNVRGENGFIGNALTFNRWESFCQVVGNVLGSAAFNPTAYTTEQSNPSGQYIITTGYPGIGNRGYNNTTSPPVPWNYPGSNFINTASVQTTNGNWVFTNDQTSVTTLVGDFSWLNSAVYVNTPGVYTLVFQDKNNPNLYYPTNNVQIYPAAAGTSSGLQINTAFSVKTGWRAYISSQDCYQQLNVSNKWTHTIQGNYDYFNNAIQWFGYTPQPIYTSLAYTNGAPSWWVAAGTNVVWPAIGPDVTSLVNLNPAGLRYAGIAAVSDPAITVQPANQTVTAPATATFSVTATGTAPLTYQWSKNGSTISGATQSSYTTLATGSGDNGATFYCDVSSAVGGPLRSSTATLTVNGGQLPAVTNLKVIGGKIFSSGTQ